MDKINRYAFLLRKHICFRPIFRVSMDELPVMPSILHQKISKTRAIENETKETINRTRTLALHIHLHKLLPTQLKQSLAPLKHNYERAFIKNEGKKNTEINQIWYNSKPKDPNTKTMLKKLQIHRGKLATQGNHGTQTSKPKQTRATSSPQTSTTNHSSTPSPLPCRSRKQRTSPPPSPPPRRLLRRRQITEGSPPHRSRRDSEVDDLTGSRQCRRFRRRASSPMPAAETNAFPDIDD